MNRTYVRRLGAALVAPMLALGVIAGTNQSAQAVTPVEAADSWLAAQVASGDHLFVSHYDSGDPEPGSFTDYGLNLDIYTALAKGGGNDVAAGDVYNAVKNHASDYVTGFGPSAGAYAKLASAVQLHDDSESAVVGNLDLVAGLEGFVQTTNTAGKRGFASAGASDFTNTITQSLATQALSTAHSDLADDTVAFLLRQQCDNGSFRETLSGSTCRATVGTVDSTSFAVQALRVAAASGLPGLEDDIADAGYWLADVQANDGSFSDAGSANANSTGLGARALQSTCLPTAAHAAAAWVTGRQLTTGSGSGAIALNDAAKAGAGTAISQLDEDQFVRATTQAVLGLGALNLPVELTVTRASQFVAAGKHSKVSATGLTPGDTIVGSIPGGVASTFTVDATGKVAASVLNPTTAGTRSVTLCDAGPTHVGSVKVTVLAARTLHVYLKYSSLRAGQTQTVTVTGTTGHEPVSLYVSNRLIKTGTAASSGTYTTTFKVTQAEGTRTVKVVGAFINRVGSQTFQVR